jgi:hypothetical protein
MESTENIIKKGDYIHKKNFGCIGKHICVEVQKIAEIPTATGILLRINGFCKAFPENLKVVTKEESERINNLFASCVISPNENDKLTSCIREDNGEPKLKIPGDIQAKRKLFSLKMKHPERNLQAYKCLHCGSYHLGKVPEVLTPETI